MNHNVKGWIVKDGKLVRSLHLGAHTQRRNVCRASKAVLILSLAALLAASCSNASVTKPPRTTSSVRVQGVTAHRIIVGSLATLSGPLASSNEGIVAGVKAYFDMVNAKGGVDGRKLDLAY